MSEEIKVDYGNIAGLIGGQRATYRGLPPAILLPARDYVYEEETKTVGIRLPITGKFSEIDPEFPSMQAGGDEFKLVRETKTGNKMLYIPDISRIMFALRYYPKLELHQAFSIVGFEIEEESVVVYGKIISILEGDDVSELQITADG